MTHRGNIMTATIRIKEQENEDFSQALLSIANTDDNKYQIMNLSREQMINLYVKLIHASNDVVDTWKEGDPHPNLKLTFNGETATYDYSTWITLFDIVGGWCMDAPCDDFSRPEIELS